MALRLSRLIRKAFSIRQTTNIVLEKGDFIVRIGDLIADRSVHDSQIGNTE
jgi:hypothetical protein